MKHNLQSLKMHLAGLGFRVYRAQGLGFLWVEGSAAKAVLNLRPRRQRLGRTFTNPSTLNKS